MIWDTLYNLVYYTALSIKHENLNVIILRRIIIIFLKAHTGRPLTRGGGARGQVHPLSPKRGVQ